MTEMQAPEDCATMAEVRAGVDEVDRAIAALLGVRFGYMRAAARIKPDRAMVRDEARKRQVIDQMVAHAKAGDWPEAVAEDLWERLVEASIAYELETFDRR
jgi:isochorismate pyruvate lyase